MKRFGRCMRQEGKPTTLFLSTRHPSAKESQALAEGLMLDGRMLAPPQFHSVDCVEGEEFTESDDPNRTQEHGVLDDNACAQLIDCVHRKGFFPALLNILHERQKLEPYVRNGHRVIVDDNEQDHGQDHVQSIKAMSLEKSVHNAYPASKSNFSSLAIDAVALPRNLRREKRGPTGPASKSNLSSLATDAAVLPRQPRREKRGLRGPASKSNFSSLAIDAAALPRQRRRAKRGPTGTLQRNSSQGGHPQEEFSVASMVLFDALALDVASCPRGRRRRATHRTAELKAAQQASALKQSSEAEIPLSHIMSSFLLPSDCSKGFDQDLVTCGSSDGTTDHGVGQIHTISDLTSLSCAEADGSHDLGIEADMY
mmetsp:Transcript_136708/g.272669  ORF Transcript_136708/g.272669 Transcript_136708/m.272669 type:complete len:369 (+) Transcript_136708:63-1169(+)